MTTPESNPRPRWTAQKKQQLVLESLRGNISVSELCRQQGISQSTFYEWKEQFLQGGLEGLSYGGLSAKEKEYRQHIAKLERKLGEVVLENTILKKTDEIMNRRRKPSD